MTYTIEFGPYLLSLCLAILVAFSLVAIGAIKAYESSFEEDKGDCPKCNYPSGRTTQHRCLGD